MNGPTLAQQRQFAERMRQLTAALDRVEALADRLQEQLESLRPAVGRDTPRRVNRG